MIWQELLDTVLKKLIPIFLQLALVAHTGSRNRECLQKHPAHPVQKKQHGHQSQRAHQSQGTKNLRHLLALDMKSRLKSIQ
jgi:hypothetical protein